MKKFIAFIILLFPLFVEAQDQLFKKDNSKIEVKILEITPAEIKYKLFTYQDGPAITISKKDVALIIYQNGVHEVITPPSEVGAANDAAVRVYNYPSAAKAKSDSSEIKKVRELTSTKNLVSMNVLDILNSSFTLSYLREFGNRLFNVYVPISFGFAEPAGTQTMYQSFSLGRYGYGGYLNEFKFTKKTFEAGLGIHFQTSGNKIVTHFVGPYIGVSQFEGTFMDANNPYVYDPITGSYIYTSQDNTKHGFVLNRYYYMLDNGLLFRVNKNFNIMMLVGLGYRQEEFVANDPDVYFKNRYGSNYSYNSYNYYATFPINSVKFALTFGYRF